MRLSNPPDPTGIISPLFLYLDRRFYFVAGRKQILSKFNSRSLQHQPLKSAILITNPFISEQQQQSRSFYTYEIIKDDGNSSLMMNSTQPLKREDRTL
jgi:hypothetical protein